MAQKWPKITQNDPKLPKLAQKWPEIAQKWPKMAQKLALAEKIAQIYLLQLQLFASLIQLATFRQPAVDFHMARPCCQVAL